MQATASQPGQARAEQEGKEHDTHDGIRKAKDRRLPSIEYITTAEYRIEVTLQWRSWILSEVNSFNGLDK